MRQKHKILLFWLLTLFLVFGQGLQNEEDTQSFTIVVDQRFKAREMYHSKEHFLGALLAIKEVGKGMFMLSPGDVDPPWASEKLIAEVLGEDYLWYPAVGNHELPEEDPRYLPYLKKMNQGGKKLPNIVRKGPPGCEETTYSFEIGDIHVAVLNVYFDGESDHGFTEGKITPELFEWLENDLKNTDKPYIFVAGHEPMVPMPDMNNGRIRHQDDSMNQYPRSTFRFHQLMKKYDVKAYFCGHTHGASIAKINGVWQIDGGHARGIENAFPEYVYLLLKKRVEQKSSSNRAQQEIITEYFKEQPAIIKYDFKKMLYLAGLTDIDYHVMEDKPGLETLIEFYKNYDSDEQLREKYKEHYKKNYQLARSTFVKIILEKPKVKAEFYRDDGRGSGQYKLVYSSYLN